MINIRNADIVYYDNDKKNITVYFDFEDSAKKFYIVPVPHLVMATTGNVPVFSLTKYISNKGDVRGLCTFDVELYVPQDALSAVKQHLDSIGKGDYAQGQFDWASVNTFFKYVLNGEEQLINMVPSMYGQNRVSFIVLLNKDEDVTTFINAFNKGEGAISPFSVEYDMTSLTKLVGVKAKVTYNVSIAVEWQRTYKTEKDTWGNSRSVLAEVKKSLKQSGAGDVLVDPVGPISDETRQRVQDWAWTTLEKMVSDSVAVANAAATSQNPVESTASFTQNYQENEVIEWSIKSSDALPMFSDEVWQKVYQEVDLRQLAVTFDLIGNFGPDSNDGVDKVDVTVYYPSREPYTETLFPTTDKNSFIYKAPGAFDGNTFIASYEYEYKVYFKDSIKQPYVSEKKSSSEVITNIIPAQLGIQSISFTGTNIPFTKITDKFAQNGDSTVDRLIIDFYFNRPEGVPNKTEQKEMKANGIAVKFDSFYVLPIENSYVYRLTYVMSDGTEMVINPVRNFGADNSNSVLINFPLKTMTFSVYASKSEDSNKSILDRILLDARYIDEQNPGLQPSNNFAPWKVDFSEDTFVANPVTWEFLAIKNPEGARYELNGTLFYKNRKPSVVRLNDYIIQATDSYVTFLSDQEQASLLIDWNAINWAVVANVEVTLFQLEGGTLPPERVKEILHPTRLQAPVEPKQVNNQSYPLLKDPKPIQPRRIYNVSRDNDSPKFEFWIGVVYNQKDGTKKYLDSQPMNTLLYTLPPNGNTSDPHISFMSVRVEN